MAEAKGDGLLADGEYDVVLLGADAKQCMLCTLLQGAGLSCLVVDENAFYGGETASLRLRDLAEMTGQDTEGLDALGRDADFSIDLATKLVMAKGELVALMVESGTAEYIEWQRVNGSFVQHKGKMHKVPATSMEAAKTPLVGVMQKRKLRNFIKQHLESDRSSAEEKQEGCVTAGQLFTQAGLDKDTQNFLGYAMALRLDASFKDEPAADVLEALRLYARSIQVAGTSPYVYPAYGLGTIAEAFSRRAALLGATFMLHTPIASVRREPGRGATIVASDGRTATARLVVASPVYRTCCSKADQALLGTPCEVIRSLCVLDKPPRAVPLGSAQVILPQSETGRRHNIYATVLSHEHRVCPEGKWVCIFSTVREDPGSGFTELDAAVNLLAPEASCRRFDSVAAAFLRPKGSQELLFAASADASTHFEATMADLRRLEAAALDCLA